MCGIAGSFKSGSVNLMLDKMDYRGKDNRSVHVYNPEVKFGHLLHAIVNFIKQPLESEKSIFLTNCEIYNWEELNLRYSLNAKNDADLMHKFLDKGYDESEFAYAAAEHAKGELNCIDIKASDFLHNINKVIYHLDFPIAGPGSFPQFMVAQNASKKEIGI